MMLNIYSKFVYILIWGVLVVPVLCAGDTQGIRDTQAVGSKPKIYIIPVTGTVEPGMAAYIRRALSDIDQDKTSMVVFKMDTFGGRVDSAFEIVEAISTIPSDRSIAFVEKKAISAGALIALSSGTLIMKENTLIGDCAPIIQTNEGQKEAGEKTQTVLRAQFRTLAKRNNYPQVLAESMVTKNMEVYRITLDNQTQYLSKTGYDDLSEAQRARITKKKTIVAKGELLTMDDKEAHDLGFSKQSVENLDQALAFLGFQDHKQVLMTESWSESLVRVLQPFLPVLMLLGIGAIYTEIKAPGFGLPGILGIFCLSLFFFNQYLVGLANYTELIVFSLGFLLLGVEVFVLPGFGVAGIMALVVLAVGLVLSLQGFVLPNPELPWEGPLMVQNLGQVMGSFLGALVVSLLMVRFVLPRMSTLVQGPYLAATLDDSHADSQEALGVSPGETGVAITLLRPSGKVGLGTKKIDAITQGDFIEPRTQIRVVQVKQNHVIVEREKGAQ